MSIQRRCSLAVESPTDTTSKNNPLHAYLVYGKNKLRSNSAPNLTELVNEDHATRAHRKVSLCDLNSLNDELDNLKKLGCRNDTTIKSTQNLETTRPQLVLSALSTNYSWHGDLYPTPDPNHHDKTLRNHHRKQSVAVKFEYPKVWS